jgi:hypothetical protein
MFFLLRLLRVISAHLTFQSFMQQATRRESNLRNFRGFAQFDSRRSRTGFAPLAAASRHPLPHCIDGDPFEHVSGVESEADDGMARFVSGVPPAVHLPFALPYIH